MGVVFTTMLDCLKPDFHSNLSPIADDILRYGKVSRSKTVNFHFLESQRKNCRKRQVVWSSIILVLRLYWGLSSIRPDKGVGGHFVNFSSSWNVHRSLVLLKYLNFKCEQSERYFFVLSFRFTALRMSHVKKVASNKRKSENKSGFIAAVKI